MAAELAVGVEAGLVVAVAEVGEPGIATPPIRWCVATTARTRVPQVGAVFLRARSLWSRANGQLRSVWYARMTSWCLPAGQEFCCSLAASGEAFGVQAVPDGQVK
jgi:hypothetical protein